MGGRGGTVRNNSDSKFEDWVDQVCGSLYYINHMPTTQVSGSMLTVFASEVTSPKLAISHADVPTLVNANKRLEQMHQWVIALKRPEGMHDSKFLRFH